MSNGVTREMSNVELHQRLDTACRGKSKVQVPIPRSSLRMRPVGARWKTWIGATRKGREVVFAGGPKRACPSRVEGVGWSVRRMVLRLPFIGAATGNQRQPAGLANKAWRTSVQEVEASVPGTKPGSPGEGTGAGSWTRKGVSVPWKRSGLVRDQRRGGWFRPSSMDLEPPGVETIRDKTPRCGGSDGENSGLRTIGRDDFGYPGRRSTGSDGITALQWVGATGALALNHLGGKGVRGTTGLAREEAGDKGCRGPLAV
jgi:hypothetical protein